MGRRCSRSNVCESEFNPREDAQLQYIIPLINQTSAAFIWDLKNEPTSNTGNNSASMIEFTMNIGQPLGRHFHNFPIIGQISIHFPFHIG